MVNNMTKRLNQLNNSSIVKQTYIDAITKSHTIYAPESAVSQQAAKSLYALPSQTVWWLWLLIEDLKKNRKDGEIPF